MNEIHRVLRHAAWRLFLIDLIRKGVMVFSAAVVALIVALLIERIFGLAVPWGRAIPGAAALAAAAALVWSLLSLRRGLAVARELDERADLRESLSTALCVSGEHDGWSEAVVESVSNPQLFVMRIRSEKSRPASRPSTTKPVFGRTSVKSSPA